MSSGAGNQTTSTHTLNALELLTMFVTEELDEDAVRSIREETPAPELVAALCWHVREMIRWVGPQVGLSPDSVLSAYRDAYWQRAAADERDGTAREPY